MIGSKLIEVVTVLSSKEKKGVEDYLEETLLPSKLRAFELWKYIVNLKVFDENSLNKEKIFSILFPDESFDTLKLRRVRSYLLKAIEDYLWLEQSRQSVYTKNLWLNHWYRKHKANKSFDYTNRVLNQHLEKSNYRDGQHYFQRFLKENEQYQYEETQKRTAPKNLQDLSDTLEIAFVLEKLKQCCTLIAHKAVYQTEYNTGLLLPILEAIEKGKYAHIPAIQVYYLIYKALEYPKENDYFLDFKTLLEQHLSIFRKEEQRTLFLLGINYCIKKINTGNQDFKMVLFELYKEGLEQTILLENGVVTRWTYINVIALGLGLKKFEWVEQFINAYKNNLEASHREDTYNFNLAKLYYTQKTYDKAMKLLLDVKFQDTFLQLNARMLLLKIYFELNESKVLMAYLNSFEVFLRRQKSVTYHKTSYLNLVSISKRIVTLNTYDKAAREKLKERIINTKVLPERDWLLGLVSNWQ